jgi:hypothetical protein
MSKKIKRTFKEFFETIFSEYYPYYEKIKNELREIKNEAYLFENSDDED